MSIIISGRNNQEFESTVAQKSTMQHNAMHMADDPRYYEPQRTNNFEFVVTGLENLVKAGMVQGEENSKIGDGASHKAQEAIRLSVTSASIPSFSQQPIEIKRGNNSVKYAGTPSFDGGSFTVVDYIGLDTLEALLAWQALSYNVNTGKVGIAQDYKKVAYLQEYTPDWQLVRTWKIVGCWITGLQLGNFDTESSGVRKVSVSFAYDWGQIDRSDVE